MDLNQFFLEPGAPSMVDFARRCDCSESQLRQWRHGYDDRRPGPARCVVIEAASAFLVRRWDLRPADWHLIWPELIGADGAPAVPACAEASHAA
jgi:DNA-binding transcriptional regulator YdaS (Cro superfamily)